MREVKKNEGWECPECHQKDVPYLSRRQCRFCYTTERARREAELRTGILAALGRFELSRSAGQSRGLD